LTNTRALCPSAQGGDYSIAKVGRLSPPAHLPCGLLRRQQLALHAECRALAQPRLGPALLHPPGVPPCARGCMRPAPLRLLLCAWASCNTSTCRSAHISVVLEPADSFAPDTSGGSSDICNILTCNLAPDGLQPPEPHGHLWLFPPQSPGPLQLLCLAAAQQLRAARPWHPVAGQSQPGI
jgi:hypothetical protein